MAALIFQPLWLFRFYRSSNASFSILGGYSSALAGKAGSDHAYKTGFSAEVVLAVPPFPCCHSYEELSKGQLVYLNPGLNSEDKAALHFAEIESPEDVLITSGASGYIGVATGTGDTVDQAVNDAYRIASHVVVPNLRFRLDIGERVKNHDWQALRSMGWLDDDAP